MTTLPARKSPIEAFGEGQVDVYFSFPPNGASDPASFGGSPIIKSIVHTATGKYTVTLDKAFRPKALIGLSCVYAFDNANPGICDLGLGAVTITAGSDTTVILYTQVGAAIADIAANAASLVKGQLRFKQYPKTDATGL
jgi:hypothetical protein